MRGVSEILRSLHGAWRLMLMDPHGLTHFENTPGAGLRSFWAMVLALPFYLGIRAIDLVIPSNELPAQPMSLGFDLGRYVVGWIFPVIVLYALVTWYGRGDRFWLFLSALNWSQILQSAGMLVVAALFAGTSTMVDMNAVATAPSLDAVVGGVAALMALMLLVLIYAYEWYVAWVSLEAGIALPIVVVLLDFVTGIGLNRISAALM